jgi:hypothetical protein
MNPTAGSTTAGIDAGELMSNVKGAVQLTFDVFDLLLDARQSAALVGVKTAQQMVGQTPFLKSGFDFVSMVMNRSYAFERDVLTRVRKTVDPKDLSFVGTSLIQPLGPETVGSAAETTSPPAIRLAAKQGTSQISVSLRLQNHLPGAEKIGLTATPFSLPGGTQQLTERISFVPASLEVPAQGMGVAKVMIDVTPDFKAGFDYQAEIIVAATHARRIPVIMTILPPDAAAEPAAGAAPAPGVKPVPSGG